MKKRYLLFSLIPVLPAAVITWLITDRVEIPSGFYSGSPFLLAAGVAIVVAAGIIAASLSSYAARHGVPCIAAEQTLSWKILNALFAMAALLNILCRAMVSRPQSSYMLPLWAVAVALEGAALVSVYFRLISERSDDPVRNVLLAGGPCLFFTADMLSRFFSASVNRNNVPLMISFLACGSLAVTSLRMMQHALSGSADTHRHFLSTACFSLIVCLGIRLPSLLFYLRKGNIFETACLAADCLAASMMFLGAYLGIPKEEPVTEEMIEDGEDGGQEEQ